MSKKYQPHYADPLGALIHKPVVGVLFAAGAGAPTNGVAGYAKACIYVDYTNAAQYENTGSVTSSTWSAVPRDGSSLAALTVTALTATKRTAGVGASTAAAGSTTTDAGVLPAGTAEVYPTSAADGTKGVRVNAADNVTGRVLTVTNPTAAILNVYPPTGGAINGLAVDAAFRGQPGGGVVIVCTDATANSGAGAFAALCAHPLDAVAASTAAAGANSGNAAVLPSGSDTYPTTAADGTKGVRIAAADNVTGKRIFVGNDAAAILKIYPPTGGTINGLAADAAFSTTSQMGAILVCRDSTANAGAGAFIAVS